MKPEKNMPIFDMKYRLRHPPYQGLSGIHQTLPSAHFFCFQMVSPDHQLITTDWQGHFMSFLLKIAPEKKTTFAGTKKCPFF